MGQRPRGDVAESKAMCILNFNGLCQSLSTVALPTSHAGRLPFPSIPASGRYCRFSSFCQSDNLIYITLKNALSPPTLHGTREINSLL